MDKEQFILSTIQPMAVHTFPYLVSILGVKDIESGEHIGSGLRCLLNGRRAVVTALHVIEKARQYPLGFALSAGYGKPPYRVSGQLHFDHDGDLAVYFLPDDYPHNNEGVAFWPQERIDQSTERLATDYLFVHGFPGQRSQFFRLVQGVASKSLPAGMMQRLENLPADLQPYQFAVDFDPENMKNPGNNAPAFADPHGLSGSAVWRIGVSGRSAAQWKPELSLVVGFLTQWDPVRKILIASLASRVLQSIHQ